MKAPAPAFAADASETRFPAFRAGDLRRLAFVLFMAFGFGMAALGAKNSPPQSCAGEDARAAEALENSRARLALASPATTAGTCDLYRAHTRALAKFSAQSAACLAQGAQVEEPAFANPRLAAEWSYYARVLQERCSGALEAA